MARCERVDERQSGETAERAWERKRERARGYGIHKHCECKNVRI